MEVHDRHYAAVVEDYHAGAQQYSQDLDDLNRRFKESGGALGPGGQRPEEGLGLFQHGKSYFSWWRNSLGALRELGPAAALEPAAMARLMLRAEAANAALDAFKTGAKGAGFLGRFLSEGGAARLAGSGRSRATATST